MLNPQERSGPVALEAPRPSSVRPRNGPDTDRDDCRDLQEETAALEFMLWSDAGLRPRRSARGVISIAPQMR
jgi:hypothetical protein